MKNHYDCIIAYIGTKQKELFDGSIKIGIEHGLIVDIREANSFDIETIKIKPEELTEKLIVALKPSFNGTLVFSFTAGEVREYGFNRTYKGEDLRKLFGA